MSRLSVCLWKIGQHEKFCLWDFKIIWKWIFFLTYFNAFFLSFMGIYYSTWVYCNWNNAVFCSKYYFLKHYFHSTNGIRKRNAREWAIKILRLTLYITCVPLFWLWCLFSSWKKFWKRFIRKKDFMVVCRHVKTDKIYQEDKTQGLCLDATCFV